jgi:AraC-like DNA-binding protein
MEILLKGTPEELPLRLAPFIAHWATVNYLKCDFGYLLSQAFLYKFYRIYIHRFIINEPSSVLVYNERGTVVLQFTTQGPMKSGITGLGEILLQSGEYTFFYLPEGIHKIWLAPGEYESFYIMTEGFLLEELAESREEVKDLLLHLQHASKEGACLSPREMDYRIQELVKDIRHCRETGNDLLIEFSTAIRNLLNFYRKSLNDLEYCQQLRATAYSAALMSIRQEITRNPSIQHHTLAYFSKKYNMSQSTLKRYFKVVFKKTLHEFVWEECMKKASFMRNNPTLSLEDIADEVGYADKSGFLKSFKQFHSRLP